MLTSRLFSRRTRRASSCEATAANAPVCARRASTPPAATRAAVEALEPRQLFAVVSGFTETLVASDLRRPTKLTVAPDGRLFVSLQGGQVRIVKGGKLLDQPFMSIPVQDAGERGLMGLAFDPGFADNHFLYAYYTTTDGPEPHNRVSRFTADGDAVVPGSEQVVIDLDRLGESNWHNGGALEFGPDGKLYVSVGENNWAQDSQQFTNTRGKILRLNTDGTIPTDNPFYEKATGKAKAMWAMGLRNPFSMDFQPGTGRLIIGDVGSGSWEEVNDGKAGANYGWPATEGPTTDDRFVTPLYAYPHDFGKSSIVGVNFYNPPTPTFPSGYVGDIFYGDYNGGFIKTLDLDTKAVKDFGEDIPGLSDIATAADGSVYYLQRDEGGRVFRVTPSAGDPAAPTISVPPQDQAVAVGGPVTFTVDAAGGAPLAYQWQRDGKNVAGATSDTYTIAAAGDDGAAFRVVVSNAAGTVTSEAAELTVVNDQPPTATITLPADDTRWTAGGQISFAGTGTDAEDGDLPADAFTWAVDFHHDTHTHPFVAPFSGKTSETIAIPAVGEPDPDIWYRIHLTVRDSAGLTHATFRDVQPQKVNLSLRAEPAGLGLELDDQPVAAPLDTAAVVGMERRLGAPASQTVNGVTYDFVSWSDGGEAVHAIATPAADTVYTAVYRARVAETPPPPPPPPGSDLAVAAVDGMKPGVAGRPGTVRVHVANRAAVATFDAPAGVELFLSQDATLDVNDMPVTTAAAARTLKLKAGATRAMVVRFTYPAVPADGDYYLLARAAGSAVTASAATLPVRNPAVDLSGSVVDTAGGAPVARGGAAATAVTLFNTGTDPVGGPLAVSLLAVPEGDDPATGARTELATLTKPVRINPGRGRKLKLNFTVPATLAPGRYTLVSVVDAGGAFAEPNEINNTSVAPVPLIVT